MSLSMDLQTLWFFLVGILLTGYAVLDGFDLGVGSLHLFSKGDEERRIMLNSIGPVWDGNEVWLVTGGGALFAAFPEAYATVFSGFYLAFMLFVFALIFRAVAIEFRSKRPMLWWRRAWDAAFSVSSLLAGLLLGVALGNVALGVPLSADREFAGSFVGLLNPFALLVGVTTVVLFAMHGSLWVVMKTEGDLEKRAQGWARRLVWVFLACYLAIAVTSFFLVPALWEPYGRQPLLWALPLLTLLAASNVPREVYRGRYPRAFLSSCATIIGLLGLFGVGMYPRMVGSAPNPEHSLTIYNASSSPKTLTVMLIIAAIGMPLVLTYTITIYRIFRGKVRLTKDSY
ncbi:MAG: cytochrome d ubiquinol oxidase subunit II [Polyangia bacterium]|jgi:cytochrome d ubiquinol oxidase subunit II|nr:cytochrome d ubiquinol oxidase subunit II [Polyangia bacterium]